MLEELNAKTLDMLLSQAPKKTYPRGSTVINAGDPSDGLYFIEYGRVHVLITDDEGREVILAALGAGEFFGEMALIDSQDRSASVVTLEETQFRIISKAAFQESLARYPEISYHMLIGLVKRLREANQKIEGLALLDVYGRLTRTLLQMARPENGQLVITNKPTHQEIANMIGASREMVTRLFRDLINGNYLSVDAHRIVLREKLPERW